MTRAMKVGAAGVLLIAVTNAVAIGGALYNRGGPPESQLLLSERELSVPHSWDWRQENSGLSLALDWNVAVNGGEDDDDAYLHPRDSTWLGAEKLAALGFDVAVAPDAADASGHYNRQLARDALLVLELDGKAYAAALDAAKRALARAHARAATLDDPLQAKGEVDSAQSRLAFAQNESTRLYVVDAGPDLASLRGKYQDKAKYAIVRGHVTIGFCSLKKAISLCGHIADLEVPTIHVPAALQPAFAQEPAPPGSKPRRQKYAALVAFGRRLEPWLVTAARGD